VSDVAIRRLDGLDDPALRPEIWDGLLRSGPTDVVFLTRAWQRAWWASFGRGRLLVLAAERAGRVVALAPLFVDGDMAFFVGSGGSDYLDFIGDLSEADVVEGLLAAARDAIPRFVGLRFYHVPDDSGTGRRLCEAAPRLGLRCFDEGELEAPFLAIEGRPEAAAAAARKRSLLRHERFFRREVQLSVRHFSQAREILPRLESFFAQHKARWDGTESPSLFLDPAQRAFYQRIARETGDEGWLRFTVLEWEGRSIAFHLGFLYRGVFLWYKPSFAIDLARRSPGEVLMRQLLLHAIEEGAAVFDLGLGSERFKDRFATGRRSVRTWGLYPAEPGPHAGQSP
jgi:CelD/BcsL family acetyltransferase involved in cellulose biosynthesis